MCVCVRVRAWVRFWFQLQTCVHTCCLVLFPTPRYTQRCMYVYMGDVLVPAYWCLDARKGADSKPSVEKIPFVCVCVCVSMRANVRACACMRVWVRMCAYVHACVGTHVCICACVCGCACVRACVCVCMLALLRVCMHTYVHTCTCKCVCLHTCVHVCVCVFMYMYVYNFFPLFLAWILVQLHLLHV